MPANRYQPTSSELTCRLTTPKERGSTVTQFAATYGKLLAVMREGLLQDNLQSELESSKKKVGNTAEHIKEIERSVQVLYGSTIVATLFFLGEIWDKDILARHSVVVFLMFVSTSFVLSIGMTSARFNWLIWHDDASQIRIAINKYSFVGALIISIAIFLFGGLNLLHDLESQTGNSIQYILDKDAERSKKNPALLNPRSESEPGKDCTVSGADRP